MYVVHATYQNADTNEGRGPMVLDRLFMDRNDAIAYLREQKGVQDRGPDLPENDNRHGWERMGDWDLRQHTVLENIHEIRLSDLNDLRAHALSKLTPEEQFALGL